MEFLSEQNREGKSEEVFENAASIGISVTYFQNASGLCVTPAGIQQAAASTTCGGDSDNFKTVLYQIQNFNSCSLAATPRGNFLLNA